MNFIKISDTTIINPEKISYIESRTELDTMNLVEVKKLIIRIDGVDKEVTVSPSELLAELSKLGLEINHGMLQYWAG